jgi:hypothetical protein
MAAISGKNSRHLVWRWLPEKRTWSLRENKAMANGHATNESEAR